MIAVPSPSASEIEQSLVRWFAARFGMGDEAAGLLVSGGAMANMVGLKAARDHVAGWNTRRESRSQSGRYPDRVRRQGHWESVRLHLRLAGP